MNNNLTLILVNIFFSGLGLLSNVLVLYYLILCLFGLDASLPLFYSFGASAVLILIVYLSPGWGYE